MKILALDTATEHCSAALWLDGVEHTKEAPLERGNGELVLALIDSLLAEAGVRLAAFDAIAFGRGPGAFTGLRLAASTAQGLGFATGRPLIPISNLRAIAWRALSVPGAPARVLVAQDARMHECYWSLFARSGPRADAGARGAEALVAESLSPPAAIEDKVTGIFLPGDWAAGSGFAAYAPELAGWREPPARVLVGLASRAQDIAALAALDGIEAGVAPEAAQPVYLRDRVAEPPVMASSQSNL